MQKMPERDRESDQDRRAGRKRIARTIGRVIELLAGAVWLLLFIAVLRTGYLSWIGIAVGTLLAGSAVVSPLFGWAGKKRLGWVGFVVHVGFVALLILSGVRAMYRSGDNDAWHPYRFDGELAAIEAKRAVPDAENAALRYDALFARMDGNDEPNTIFSGVTVRDEFGTRPWKSVDHPQTSRWLDSQTGLIDELLEIGTMEKCRWPIHADADAGDAVPRKELRRGVQLLVACGNRDLGEDRIESALIKYFCVLRIADHLGQQTSTMDYLTAFGCEISAQQMIRHVLIESHLPVGLIAKIADHLPPVTDPWPQEWEALSEAERLRYMNLLGRLYEINDRGTVRFTTDLMPVFVDKFQSDDRDWTFKIPPLYWLMTMPRDPQAVHRLVDEYFAAFDPMLTSEHMPQTEADGLPPLLPELPRMFCNPYRWLWELTTFNDVEYAQYRRHLATGVVSRRGTWLVIGLRRYRDAHGAWPEGLDAVAEYVPAEALVDPMSGGAFVYVLDGDGFRLYSKGVNRIDEGGRYGYVKALDMSQDDIALWPPVPPPKPADEESRKKELEDIYGKDFVEAHLKHKGSDKR